MVPKVTNNEDIVLRNMSIKDYLETNDNKGSYIKINSTNIDDDDDGVDDCDNTKMSNNVLITNTDNNNNLNDDFIEPLIITPYKQETWYAIALQVLIPYIIAGFGTVGAGLVLDIVQHWTIFIEIKEIYVLVPALLGLKGNLEMTLASRFSTQANIGLLNSKKNVISAILGNFALTQGQAIIVGALASFGAILLRLFSEGEFHPLSALVLTSSSIATASVASFLLAAVMMVVIILSQKLSINPDNIATPIAASLGDLVTLSILATVGTLLYQIREMFWIHILLISFFFLMTPILIYFSHINEFVKDALRDGWVPVIIAMLISSLGGLILGFAVDYYNGIAVFQPVINGVGGNLVAVFASRLSTTLHKTAVKGVAADWAPKSVLSIPFQAFFGKKNPESTTARVLILISIPGHVLFMLSISKIKAGHVSLTPDFVIFFLSAAFLQISLLLLICYWFVHFIWKRNLDPDNVCIPYLTALGDFLGTSFLAICFHTLYLMGHKTLRTKI